MPYEHPLSDVMVKALLAANDHPEGQVPPNAPTRYALVKRKLADERWVPYIDRKGRERKQLRAYLNEAGRRKARELAAVLDPANTVHGIDVVYWAAQPESRVDADTLGRRLRQGWELVRALSTPVGESKENR